MGQQVYNCCGGPDALENDKYWDKLNQEENIPFKRDPSTIIHSDSEDEHDKQIPMSKKIQKITNEYITACETSDFDEARFLYEEHPKIDFKNVILKNGNTPLHESVLHKNSVFALFLLQHGADINCINTKNGNTPMHIAAELENIRMATLLTQWHADINIRNKMGITPKDMAIKSDNQDLKDLFGDELQDFYGHMEVPASRYGLSEVDKTKKRRSRAFHEAPGSKLKDQMNQTGGLMSLLENNEPLAESKEDESDSNDDDDYDDLDDNELDNEMTTPIPETPINAVPVNFGQPKAKKIKKFNHRRLSQERRKKLLSIKQTTESRRYLLNERKKEEQTLTPLQGWLDKRRPKPPKIWQKRYVAVRANFLMWNDKAIRIHGDDDNSVLSNTEKRKWKKTIWLYDISNVERVMKHDGLQFLVNTKPKKMHNYLFRCKSKNDVEYWILGLRQHISRLHDSIDSLHSLNK